jgi:glycosyltransferase involved in cell wall biosynthesis
VISVIIPSYQREHDLLRALDSLRDQSLPAAEFEVIVVDDGSDYDPAGMLGLAFPFRFQYVRQENAGATAARNAGVRLSRGEVLAFMDDDVTALAPALAALGEACAAEGVVAVGNLATRVPDADTVFARRAGEQQPAAPAGGKRELSFTKCNTQLLAVRRADFDRLGGLQDPTGGWPNWDDVDFGYRAHQAGMRVVECGAAQAVHWDRSLASLQKTCARWFRAAESAVRLLRVHPGLAAHLPMFHDKLPPAPGDPPALARRKRLRRMLSSPFALRLLETAAALVEKFSFLHGMLGPLYRWIIGGYIYRGYRSGLLKE